MLRSLTHYWKVNLAVLLGAAVASAVLTGALLVGDSVRESLRDLARERLGRIDEALLSERFFREDLAIDASAVAGADVAPVILLRGSATDSSTRARASGISVLGIDERFPAMFPGPPGTFDFDRARGQLFPSVILNESLAAELRARAGDAILLSFPLGDDVPRDTILGRRDVEHVLGTMRCTVAGVIPDRGPGRFGLSARQDLPRIAFLALSDLQRALDQEGGVNALLAAGPIPEEEVRARLRLEDLGLFLARTPAYVAVQSREFVLRPPAVEAVEAAAAAIGAPVLPFQTYLANEIRLGDRVVPYSMITAVDPPQDGPFARLRLLDGFPAPDLGADGILLNTWAAHDLGARPSDLVRIAYFIVGDREELTVQETSFRVRGIVPMEGLAADPDLTPRYPGIGDSPDMASWDPPFPVDLRRIRPADERYWDEFRGTPKAFVSAVAGRRMWANRFGTVTAVQVGPAPGSDLATTAGQLEAEILRAADAAAFGYRFLPVKAESLEASAGATDFSGLFLAFSMFLIFSAALLVALLFRLGVEQRAAEVGLLLALGHRVRAVRRRFLAEGSLLASAGATAGIIGGVGYAWLMMIGLRTWWRPAVGTSHLFLHVAPMSLAIGWIASVLVVVISIVGTVRQLGRLPVVGLLAGSMRGAAGGRSRGLAARAVGFGGLAATVILIGIATISGAGSSAGVFFGAGTLLLVSGLAFFSLWCRQVRRAGAVLPGPGALAAMAARNSAASPGRSILSAAMVACACFVIVAAAANRHDFRAEGTGLGSGAGGYSLVAQSDVPLYQDLGSRDGRFELGLPAAADEALDGLEVTAFRLLPGDDASCLNLYRPKRPRVLGVPRQQIERGGFTFSAVAGDAGDPWALLEEEIGPGVIPAFGDANSVQWILHLGLGEDVVLEDEYGREVRLRLVGLLQKSLFQSDILISEEAFLRHFPGRGGHRVFLIDTGAAVPEDVASLLENGLSSFGFDVTSTADRLASFEVVQNTYISTFLALGGLGLLLGTVGLGVIMVRNVLERRGELATLRAFGFRKPRLGWMVLTENAFLLVLGVGLGAGSALVAIVPHITATGSAIPWFSLALTLIGVLAVGLLSSVAAVRSVLRTPLLPALKAEP